jgi:cupin superfamily acireductone dioxygenase involved in methionine salvage
MTECFYIAAKQKLELTGKVVVYIEDNGTEVDEDEILMRYEQNSTFIVCVEWQKWNPAVAVPLPAEAEKINKKWRSLVNEIANTNEYSASGT